MSELYKRKERNKNFDPMRKAKETVISYSRPISARAHIALQDRYGFSTSDIRIGGAGDKRFIVIHENSKPEWLEALGMIPEDLTGGENVFHMRVGALNMFSVNHPKIAEMADVISGAD